MTILLAILCVGIGFVLGTAYGYDIKSKSVEREKGIEKVN
jgi:hypothetical protein